MRRDNSIADTGERRCLCFLKVGMTDIEDVENIALPEPENPSRVHAPIRPWARGGRNRIIGLRFFARRSKSAFDRASISKQYTARPITNSTS
jgi:pyocin large subunit-like protein